MSLKEATYPINENSPKHTGLVKVNTTEINTYALIWYVIFLLMFFILQKWIKYEGIFRVVFH